MKNNLKIAALLTSISTVSAVFAIPVSSVSAASQNIITLQFLQNKTEAVGEFNALIKEFEKQNPTIKVQQINPPNADTVLLTDLTKNQLPDVIAMGADSTFIEMAQTGVLHNYAGSAELKKANPTYVKMLEKETARTSPYGIPLTVNAEPILYNKPLFAKYHLTIPTTWNQLIKEAKRVKALGGTPFFFGFKDSWTTMVPWNALAANNQGGNFFNQLKAGKTTFAKSYGVIANRMVQLATLGQKNEFGVGYNSANTAFAKGKSVFYIQGDWAVSSILQANPKAKIGSFAFPATNNPKTNKLVSGIDSLLTMSATTHYKAASQKFIDFLLQKKIVQAYCNNQKLFSAIKGVKQTDPIVANLQSYIERGQISDYPDHYYPPAMDANVANMIQGFLVNKQPVTQFLGSLDSAYHRAVTQ